MRMAGPPLHAFSDRRRLDQRLAADLATTLRAAIAERGSASLVVSGGRTPRNMLRALAAAPLDWRRVTVTLADERWVPPAHEDSNERLVRECLLQGPAAQARIVSLVSEAPDPSTGCAAIAARLSGLGTFDAVVLGMGEDGHTASLFPGTDALAAALDLSNAQPCIAVQPRDAPHPRLSMTLQRLLDTRTLAVQVTGEAKRAVLARALASGDPRAYPVAAVLASQDPSPEIYWAP
jgi:6-phosphogluconolactonase